MPKTPRHVQERWAFIAEKLKPVARLDWPVYPCLWAPWTRPSYINCPQTGPMPRSSLLPIYAQPELGAYGYVEKPWFAPHVRLEALLKALDERGLGQALERRSAPAASDVQLAAFHSKAYVEQVTARCTEGRGSLDTAHPRVVDDVRRLLRATAAQQAPTLISVAAAFEDSLAPAMTFEGYLGYLSKEGLLAVDGDGQTLSVTPRGRAWLRGETPWFGGPTLARASVETAARHVAGATIDAMTRILAGEFQQAFIPIAGFHHAHREEARMYCLYNDPALAIMTALQHGVGRVAYVDIDIHHGDGVHHGFAANPRVCLVDLHEAPRTLFPFTPESPDPAATEPTPWVHQIAESDAARVFNVGLAPETDDATYRALWRRAEAFIEASEPDVIVMVSGVDGLGADPMSHQALTPDAIAYVTRRVRAVAERHARGRLLVLGGGGYAIDSLCSGWCAVVEALVDA